MHIIFKLCGAMAVLSVAACGKGPNEAAGEKTDQAIENTTNTPQVGDGPNENAGEAMDDAAADKLNSQAGAVRDEAEKRADTMENKADAVRDQAEKKADMLENKADKQNP